jgi:phage tail sheath protein FI
MMNYIKRVSVAAVRPEIFEPNDATLWGQLTKLLTPIYQEIKNKRGLNNFQVKFDSSTTNNLARDNNEVYGYIVLEPTKAAEKIILSFVVTAQGASFTEALAAAGVV